MNMRQNWFWLEENKMYIRNIRGQEDTRSILEDTRLIFGRFAVNILALPH